MDVKVLPFNEKNASNKRGVKPDSSKKVTSDCLTFFCHLSIKSIPDKPIPTTTRCGEFSLLFWSILFFKINV